MRGAPGRRVVGLGLALAAVPELARGCAVCFGGADAAMTEGMNAGILALLGFVGVVQVGFIALFLRFRQRSRRLRERRESLHLIQGGLH